MSDAQWYYVDAARQQVGPVSADEIRAGVGAGKLSATSLVWREGMAQWLPLAQLSDELGLAGKFPPAASLQGAQLVPESIGDTAHPPGIVSAAATRAGVADVVYAGFVRRWAALFLDGLIVGIPAAILAVVIAMAIGISFAAVEAGDAAPLAFYGVYYLIYFTAAGLYFAGMESSSQQATLGKRALGIKVTDLDGRQLSFGHAFGRWMAASLSYLTIYIGFLMAAFTDRKQALHDMVASTLVVDRWAFTDSPERQKRGLSGCLVAFLVCACLLPVLIAIFAAIAISQYQDYVTRSQAEQSASLYQPAPVSEVRPG